MPDPDSSGGPAPSALAARQAALVRALVADGPTPAGFDVARVRATSMSLRRKRARVVAHAWPALRSVPDYESRYAGWALGRAPGSATEDGVAFAATLGRECPAAVGVELVAARRRRWIRVRGGIVVRWCGLHQLGGY
jgi:hypothetical protein